MVFRGHFTLNYDGREYAMRPGLMLAAGMGYEHGVGPSGGALRSRGHGHATRRSACATDTSVRDMHGAPVKNRAVPEEALEAHRKTAVAQTT